MSDKKTVGRVERDGKVAVLYSPRYGAGWSTWNRENREFFLFDPGLVELAERNASSDEVEVYIRASDIEDAEHAYLGGWDNIRIEWMDKGESFAVEEYDGSESFRYRDSEDWSVA